MIDYQLLNKCGQQCGQWNSQTFIPKDKKWHTKKYKRNETVDRRHKRDNQ